MLLCFIDPHINIKDSSNVVFVVVVHPPSRSCPKSLTICNNLFFVLAFDSIRILRIISV